MALCKLPPLSQPDLQRQRLLKMLLAEPISGLPGPHV